jgi:SOS-response transcriptional repressor LexA
MCMKKLLPLQNANQNGSDEAEPTRLLPLTLKEKSVLRLHRVRTYATKGISPSYQEICDHFGFASFNSVQNYLKQLSNKGYVQIPQNQKRAIHINPLSPGLSQRPQRTPHEARKSHHALQVSPLTTLQKF